MTALLLKILFDSINMDRFIGHKVKLKFIRLVIDSINMDRFIENDMSKITNNVSLTVSIWIDL